jgi:hypothetical protein
MCLLADDNSDFAQLYKKVQILPGDIRADDTADARVMTERDGPVCVVRESDVEYP